MGRSAIVAQQGVCEGDLLVTSRIQNFTLPSGALVVAQDLDTGAERWAVDLPYDFPGSSWRSRVTAVRDGQVYATRAGNTNDDPLYALDPADGSILWRSVGLIDESTTESVAFAEDGDVIAGNETSVIRIEHTDGTTVWQVPRSCPTSSGCQVAVYGDRFYLWEPSASGPFVTAFNVADGSRRYSSPPVAGGFIQQVGLFCGPDGTVYAPRSQNNPSTDFLVAFEDTGSGLVEKWRRPLGFCPFASFGVGPDGSVYSYSRALEVERLDPASGALVDSSAPIPFDVVFSPRMAIDAEGRVYLTNGGSSSGRLYAFSPDLTELWSQPVPGVNLGGPVLGQEGTLVVCGTGTVVRAYRSSTTDVAAASGLTPLVQASPNPFATGTAFLVGLREAGPVHLEVFDARGRLVRTVFGGTVAAGKHVFRWNGLDEHGREAPPGVYVVSASADGRRSGHTVNKVR